METGDCGDALLFLWAFQITDSDREDSLNVWSSNIWEWTCQQLIVVPQVCGKFLDEVKAAEMQLHLHLLWCGHTDAFCNQLANCCWSTQLQEVISQVIAPIILRQSPANWWCVMCSILEDGCPREDTQGASWQGRARQVTREPRIRMLVSCEPWGLSDADWVLGGVCFLVFFFC